MKIKKYIASSLKEGKGKVLAELGDDAVVLSSRTITDPDTGRELTEIVAAIDDGAIRKARKSVSPSQSPESRPGPPAGKHAQDNKIVLEEIDSLKEMMRDISTYVKYRYAGSMNPVIARLYKALIEAEFSENYALKVTGMVSTLGYISKFSDAVSEARKIISRDIYITRPLGKPSGRKVVAFVGTTGGGKTTSLIKIAALSKLLHGANCLVVSADTYKIGGAEQLQTYTSVASMGFKAAYKPGDLKEIVTSETDRDYIFIDTTGRSQNNSGHLGEIKEFIDAARPDMIYLVQSATTGLKTFKNVVEKFGIFTPDAVILTKLDESGAIGGILTYLTEKKIPVAYLANGQRVPEDLEPADKMEIGKFALNDEIINSKEVKETNE
jgi:flagellar biosynthesis protein FlhF